MGIERRIYTSDKWYKYVNEYIPFHFLYIILIGTNSKRNEIYWKFDNNTDQDNGMER